MIAPAAAPRRPTNSPRISSNSSARAMRPLVVALVAIWPLHSLAAVPVAGVRQGPAINAVPVPALNWQQSRKSYDDSSRSSLSERPNAQGGIDQVIDQRLTREIYLWKRFDIGKASKVEFMLPSGGAALNRVEAGAEPSLIFGTLTSTVPNPNTAAGQPARIVGGDVYLLNGNGILFGGKAEVNVGALVASTLNVDNEDFLNGLTRSINGAQRSFWRDPLGLPATLEAPGFVEVEPEVKIRTPNGGRVFLFAEDVKQAGRIETPGGQTVLAAGSEVYLQAPTAEKLYAAEHNAAVPALRGLLVEVGGETGRVEQLGEILSARGNTTLVGLAVNQMGRISASTSVSENGSVFLLARGKASAQSVEGQLRKRATEGGSLVLGDKSRIEITAEASQDATPVSAGFTPSRIEMSGRSIELQGSASGGAQIVAPGAQVRLRAESQPVYEVRQDGNALTLPKLDKPAFDDQSRLVLGERVSIDLSGTQGTEISAARHYVTTELLGANDLKDAPLQKEGMLYRAKVTLDIRQDSKILGSLESYRQAVNKTVQERLSVGGSLMLESAGALAAHSGSSLNLSGGSLRYLADQARPSQLRGADGQLYDLNNAPADLRYSGLSNATYNFFSRWGAVRSFVSGPTLSLERYDEGQSAGSLRVLAGQTRLEGEIKAATLVGERQRAGLDKLAARGSFQLGQASATATGVQQDLVLGASNRADVTALDLARLDAAGFGRYVLASDGGIRQQQALQLAPRASLSLYARGSAGVSLEADLQSAGGSLSVQTVARPEVDGAQPGDIVVAPGVRLDVAGRLLNQERDGAQPQASAAGGSLKLNSGAGLVLGQGARLDVSGGATVSGTGKLQAGAAGAIELRSSLVNLQPRRLEIEGAELLGLSLGKGGSLSLRAAEVQIGGTPASVPGVGRLQLGAEFFSRGGFERFEIDGQLGLAVARDTQLAPRLLNQGVDEKSLRLDPATGQPRASGALLADLGKPQTLQDESLRRPVNLDLQSSLGSLQLAQGARIALDPLASLSLTAAADLRMDGRLESAGGTVSLKQGAGTTVNPGEQLQLGAGASIDVSGRLLATPGSDGLRRGRVLDGGRVLIDAQSLQWAAGSEIRADGASARLDAPSRNGAVFPEGRNQLISSDAGSLSLALFSNAQQDSLLAGRFVAQAGAAGRADGLLSVSLGRKTSSEAPASHRLLLQAITPDQVRAAALSGVRTVQLGTELFSAALADLSLASQDRLVLAGSQSLAPTRRLLLDSPQILLEGDALARLGAASVTLGASFLPEKSPQLPASGKGSLSVQAGTVLDVFGHLQVGGASQVQLSSGGDLRLHAGLYTDPARANTGSLKADAALTLAAAQVYGTSASRFEVDVGAQRLLITRPEGASATEPAAPLSAGAVLSFKAREIVQDGLLRAPLGRLSLQASESLLLSPRSLSSVSGAGLTVPYGATVAGEAWYYGSQANGLTALPAKQIDLKAPRLELQGEGTAQARLDLSGGGALQALEFVAGPGGSRDVFAESFDGRSGAFAIVPGTALAPLDNHMAQAGINATAGRELVLDQDLRFGEQLLNAGRYAVLPARYALLPGSFLLRPEALGDTPVTGATQQRRDNGALLAGARLASSGSTIIDARASTFLITPSATARKSAEIRVQEGDAYVLARAQREGLPRPAAAIDAGHLNLSAQQLVLSAQLRLAAADKGQAGSLAIAAERLRVGMGERPADLAADTLWLSAQTLAGSGASRLLLGAQRGLDAQGQALAEVQTRSLQIDAGTRLEGFGELMAMASQSLAVGEGAQLRAATPAAGAEAPVASTLRVKGDGASLRLGAVSGESLARSEAGSAPQGLLSLGADSLLAGPSLALESAGRFDLAGSAGLQVAALELGAGRILIGEGEAARPGELRLNERQLQPFLAADSLALRSQSDIAFEAGASLGGAGLGRLILDAAVLTVREGGRASASARQLELRNRGAAGATPLSTGSARLSLAALDGSLQIGPGSVQLQGLAGAELQASQEIRLSGQGGLQTAGDLSLAAPRVSADAGTRQQLQAGGLLTLQRREGAVSGRALGEGAQLSLSARELRQGGVIVLPSGQLELQAQGALRFEAGSQTQLSGLAHVFDGETVNTPGGRLKAVSSTGDLVLAAGARLDVSGAGQGAQQAAGGDLRLAAPQGRLELQGELLGRQASLWLDSRQALDLGALARRLAADGGQFGELISVRNRQGDQVLPAGAELAARRLEIAADQGALLLQGSLRAEGEQGALISVAAGGDLRVAAGAQLRAANRGQGIDGGEIRVMTSAGRLSLEEGARLSTPGGEDGREGEVLLRAPRTGVEEVSGKRGGTGVAVERLRASFEAVRRIEVEAVRRYEDITLISETATGVPTPAPTSTPAPTNTPAPTQAPTSSPAPTPAPTNTPAPTTPPTEPSAGNGNNTTPGKVPPAPPTGPKTASLMQASSLPAGQAPASLLATVRIAAAEPTQPSPGNGNDTTIGNKPPAPPVGPPTAAPTPAPTSAPGPGPAPTPAPSPSPAPTPAPVPTPPPKILKPSVVEADNLAFVGSKAANTQRMVAELAGGNAALAAKLSVAPGVEIRSPGRLSLESEWNLMPVSGSRVGEAMRLSLRAGGDLTVLNSLSDGFAAARTATDKRAIAANGVALAGRAASFRLVAGSDLTAADPLTVNGSENATGSLIIGKPAATASGTPPIVFIRSTTGSIAMAAAADINLGAALNAQGRNGQVRIYTTGEPAAALSRQDLQRLGLLTPPVLLDGSTTGSYAGPFFEHAGAIGLSAGRDLLGLPAYRYGGTGVQYVSDWWWRQVNDTAANKGLAFWVRYDQFAQGIASFGGGNIALRAGRDLVDVEASTPLTGYSVKAEGTPGQQDFREARSVWYAGGSLSASAGRDVRGGLYNAGGAEASLSAGGRIGEGSGQNLSQKAPQLFYLDTAWTVTAAGDLMLGWLGNPALLAGAKQGSGVPPSGVALGLADRAQARLLSVAGDIGLTGRQPDGVPANRAGDALLPDSLLMAAPQGRITLEKALTQRPAGEAALSLLAGEGLQLKGGLRVMAGQALETAPQPLSAAGLAELMADWNGSKAENPNASRQALHLVSSEGDLNLGSQSFSARPLRVQAGEDLLLGEVNIQHRGATELSLLQAGRDLLLNGSGSSGVKLGGPGDLLALAGRDADLRGGIGLESRGNLDNATQLPRGGAAVTVITAYKPQDPTQAQAGGFALLGGGLQHQTALLAVQLKAISETGQPLDAAKAQVQAKAFVAQRPEAQRAQVQALVGEGLLARESEAYLSQAVTLAEAQSRAAGEAVAGGRVGGSGRDPARPPLAGSEFLPGNPRLAPADAAARDGAQAEVRAELREALQGQALGAALAAKARELGAERYGQLLQAVSPHAGALRDFVNGRLGGPVRDGATAWRDFASLPQEQQLIFMQQTLMGELQAAGRAAAAGDRGAYLRGYQAMAALYPEAGTRDGRLLLANSQIKTSQGGAITLLAPGGSINVGDLVGDTSKSAASVGIVSVAGGSVRAAVRDSVEVNQSRVFTLAQGDVLLWAGLGNLDAGRGAKTVMGAPPPLFGLDAQGRVVVDTSGSFSGSGIAVLDKASALDLYAPLGEINAGDAGIKSAGNLFLGATVVRGADNIAVGGSTSGATLTAPPPPPPVVAAPTPAATEAGKRDTSGGDEDESRKRRPRRNLLLEFLGFGSSGD